MKTQRKSLTARIMRELELHILSLREPFNLDDLAVAFPHIPRPSIANKVARLYQDHKLDLISREIINKHHLSIYQVSAQTYVDPEEKLAHIMGAHRYEDMRVKPSVRAPLTHLLYGAGIFQPAPSKDML